MSDNNMTRRGFLAGAGASSAMMLAPQFAAAQARAAQTQYLVLTDPNHVNYNIRFLNNRSALSKMADAGYKDIFVEFPPDFRDIKNNPNEIFRWHIAGYMEPLKQEVPRAIYEEKRNYMLGARAHLNALERTAYDLGMRVHYVDPMHTSEMLKLSLTESTTEFNRQRKTIDPDMASNISGISNKGIVFVGALHGDGMRSGLRNAEVHSVGSFSRIANNFGPVVSTVQAPGMAPG